MLAEATALADELVRLRRDIHAHPELGFQETRTAALVADTLREIGGIEVRSGVGITGVVGDIGSDDGPTIAIRADMDALPIVEENAAEYRSLNNGVMHACGHDAHTAMLLGAAHLLRQRIAQESLRGRVRLLFQPSEESWDAEGLSGASRMINDGALEGVDAVIALHVDSRRPTGRIVIRSGFDTAAVDTFHGAILGSGAHGAYPHTGTDPIWMLASVLTALHGIVSRRINPVHPAVVTVGKVHGGSATNIIPTEVSLEGTLRSFDPAVREQLLVEVEQAFAVARAFGGDYRVHFQRGYIAGRNDARVAGWMADGVERMLGGAAIDQVPAAMGAEDFAYMSKQVPGAMLHLGAATPDGVMRNHHTPVFDIDERALPIGAALLADTAVRFLRGEAKL